MLASKHHPNGTEHHLDNDRLEACIFRYQAQGDAESLTEILQLTKRRALALARFYHCGRYLPEAELLADVHIKLMHNISRFDPTRSSGFSYASRIISTALITAVSRVQKAADRYAELDEAAASKLVSGGDSQAREGLDDLLHKIKTRVQTTLTEPELAIQKWYTESFTQDGFEAKRREAAHAATVVFPNLTLQRAFELHDLSRLAVRKALCDDVIRREPIVPAKLRGTKHGWMLRFRSLMSESEFQRFFVLLRDLSPFCVLLADPANHSRRQDRCAPVSRRTIEAVLYARAKPLFSRSEG